MELDEVPVEVCVDVGVDGPVNLFALLDQAAQRLPDNGALSLTTFEVAADAGQHRDVRVDRFALGHRGKWTGSGNP